MELIEMYNMFNAVFFSLGQNMRFWKFNSETFNKNTAFGLLLCLGFLSTVLKTYEKNTFKGSFHFLWDEF